MKLTPTVSVLPTSMLPFRARLSLSSFAVAMMLSACGGGGSSSSDTGTNVTDTVGGSVAGLTVNGLILSNGTDTVSVAANANAFSAPAGGNLIIAHQPIGFTQACALGGTASSPQVSCSAGVANVSWYAGNNFGETNGLLPQNGVIQGPDGRLYGCTSKVIYSAAADGAGGFSIVAGSPWNTGLINGQGTAARFNSINGLKMDTQGNFYVIDEGQRGAAILRKVTPAGVVTTMPYSFPNGLYAFAIDAAGEINYVDNTRGALYHLNAQGVQTTVVDLSGVTHAASPTQPYRIDDFVLSSDGMLYFADQFNASVYKLDTNANGGTAPTLVAGADDGTLGDVDATGVNARFGDVYGLVLGANNTLYALDQNGSKLKRIASDGTVKTIVSSDTVGSSLYYATINAAPGGNALYLSQNSLSLPLLKVDNLGADTATTTALLDSSVMAGKTGDAKSANLSRLAGASSDASGNLYVNDYDSAWNAQTSSYDYRQVIRKINTQGVINTVGALGVNLGSEVVAVNVGADGQVYAAHQCGIQRMTSSGEVTTLWGDINSTSCDSITDMAISASGNVYVTTDSGSLNVVSSGGALTTLTLVDGSGNAVPLLFGALTLGDTNTLYATTGTQVYRVSLSAQANVATLVAGTTSSGNADGAALNDATFGGLSSIARDTLGNLYVTQAGGGFHRPRIGSNAPPDHHQRDCAHDRRQQ